MKFKKAIKEFLIIFIVAAVIGLSINFVNPKGIPLIMDASRYSAENSENIKKELTDSAKIPKHRKNKEGFIEPQNIKLDVAKLLFDRGALFIDARPAADYSAGHVNTSINLPYEDFHKKSAEERVNALKDYDKEKPIVCYCNGGDCEMSIDLAYDIARAGFNNLYIYLGGYKEWETAGHPVERK